MESCLYEGSVHHRRREPVEHAFSAPLYLLYLDLAEIDHVFRGSAWASARRPAFARFRREDHLGPASEPLEACVRDLVEREAGVRPSGPVRLLTQLRIAGYGMNPVSFYYCFDASGTRIGHVVAEVNNTPWGEQHAYVLPVRATADGILHATAPKTFHVSPFMEMERTYRFAFSPPGERLRVSIRSEGGPGALPFDATLALERLPLTARSHARMLRRHPLAPHGVTAGIYRQAFSLWRKGARFHPHPGAAERPLETPS